MARPRSARAHADVLDAAAALFAERGLDATSMDAIAERSGVSKATIYKHWPDKDALCLEVMGRIYGSDIEDLPDFDSGDLRADLIEILGQQPPPQYAGLRQRIMPHLIAYAARNPEFGHAWRVRVLNPPRTQLKLALERAIARGLLASSLSTELGISMLFGSLFYRYVVKLAEPGKPDPMREQIVDAFLKAYAQPQPSLPQAHPARPARSTPRSSGGTAPTRSRRQSQSR